MMLYGAQGPACNARQPGEGLPQPQYERQSNDPGWLQQVVQFHGHLGPWVVAGARFGMAGLQAVGARGYFDIEVTCEGPFAQPPEGCFLDGLQVATGATLGKRNLHWVQAERIAVRLKNTKTGKTATLCPTPALLDLLASVKPSSKPGSAVPDPQAAHGQLESLARRIASLPTSEILAVHTAR